MLDTPGIYVVFAVFVLGGPVRVGLRLRAQIRATGRAHALGSVTCPKCSAQGPLFGYGTFFAQERLRCRKCGAGVAPSSALK